MKSYINLDKFNFAFYCISLARNDKFISFWNQSEEKKKKLILFIVSRYLPMSSENYFLITFNFFTTLKF